MPIKESQIQSAIEEYLQVLRKQKKVLYLKNNTGAFGVRNPSGSRSYVRFGMKGSPDFIVFLPHGRCMHVEVKRPGGKLRESQEQWWKNVSALGHHYFVVDSLGMFKEAYDILIEEYAKLAKSNS